MDHKFAQSVVDPNRCVRCQFDEISHTDKATCECCDNSGPMEVWCGMLMCASCIEKEKALQAENNTELKQAERVKAVNSQILEARAQDSSIELRTDLFNAATTSIIELKSIIDSDPNIENKNYALASELKLRFEHFTKVIFQARQELAEAGNQQRAIQTHLNELANKLRQEEREKLKLQDINYTPQAPKTPKPPKTGKPKVTPRAVIKELAQKYQIPEAILQMTITARKMEPEAAAKMVAEQLKSKAN
jgi:hypothetical protein